MSRYKAMMQYQKGGKVKETGLQSVIDSLEPDSSNAWGKYNNEGKDWLKHFASQDEVNYVDSVRSSLLDRMMQSPESIPQYQEGGYISGLRGLLSRGKREAEEEKSLLKKQREISKKATKSGVFGKVGKYTGKLLAKMAGKAASLSGIPGLDKLVEYGLNPLLVGGLTKFGAELGYGDTVDIDKGPWFKSAKGETRGFQKDVRGGFQDVGQAAAMGQFGQAAYSDISKYLDKIPEKPERPDLPSNADMTEDFDNFTKLDSPAPEIPNSKDFDNFTEISMGNTPESKLLSDDSFDRSFLAPQWERAKEGEGLDVYKSKSPWPSPFRRGLTGYQEGGEVENSLLFRTFGKKSNLFE